MLCWHGCCLLIYLYGAVLALIATACLTSAMTAALGIGGGVLLLAIMSMLLPAAAIIPLHGLVQLGSNANRAAFTAKHIRWPALYWFIPGVLLGAGLASVLLVELLSDDCRRRCRDETRFRLAEQNLGSAFYPYF